MLGATIGSEWSANLWNEPCRASKSVEARIQVCCEYATSSKHWPQHYNYVMIALRCCPKMDWSRERKAFVSSVIIRLLMQKNTRERRGKRSIFSLWPSMLHFPQPIPKNCIIQENPSTLSLQHLTIWFFFQINKIFLQI